MKLNFNKLTEQLENKKQLSKDDLLVRSLLENCTCQSIDYSLLDKLSARHFLMAKKIINEAKSGNLGPLADLSLNEFVKENILSTEEIYEHDDDFDVYL